MNPADTLSGLRLGCVQYLNSRPLIYGLPGVELAHPSELAAKLRAGAIDAALVPVFELLRSPRDYCFVDGVGIVSHGPVYSVYVAHQRPIRELRGVVADPASLTSVHLFQVLASGILAKDTPLLPPSSLLCDDPDYGRLLIGNQAIDYRLAAEPAGSREGFWDLGEQWTGWTGLPFVYAVWVLRKGLTSREKVADALRAVAALGTAATSEIVSLETGYPQSFSERYLTEHIQFFLGDWERAGLTRFSELLENQGLVGTNRGELDAV
jgi:chorismate dehydratase